MYLQFKCKKKHNETAVSQFIRIIKIEIKRQLTQFKIDKVFHSSYISFLKCE